MAADLITSKRPPQPAEPPRGQMTILGHLEELRKRLWICMITIVVTSLISFRYAEGVITWLKRPAGSSLPKLAFFTPTEALTAYMQVAVVCGVILALPIVLAQIWAFVKPALTWKERYYGLAFVGWGSVLFAAGVAFAYFGMLPTFLTFLLGFGGPDLQPVISIHQYLSFVLGIVLASGILFELPLVIVILTRIGLLTPESLQRHRSIAVIVLLTIAAIVTPTTDAVSMVLFSIPLLVLYELSIWVSHCSIRHH